MTDVVIRSASDHDGLARQLERGLVDAGFEAWRANGADEDFWLSDEIVERIRTAKASIFIWSEGAAASALICNEANAARRQKKLIQISGDGRAPPSPFDRSSYVQLNGWNGEAGHPGLRQLVQQLETLSGAGGGAKTGRRIGLSSLPWGRRTPTDAPAASLPIDPRASRRRRRIEPATALLLIALTSAAGAAGWVGGRQQGLREGSERIAAANTIIPRVPPAADGATAGAAARGASPIRAPAPRNVLTAAATPSRPAAFAQLKTKAPSETRPKATTGNDRERTKSVTKARASTRPKLAAKPKPAKPRIRYRYAENMRLFCQGAGKTTPECQVFRRNAPRRRR